MIITILKICGIGFIAGALLVGLIFSLANLIWGIMTWEKEK